MKKEANFKTELYEKIRNEFPGSEVVPNDPGHRQGFPDATVYFPNVKYFLLDGKRNITSPKRPNQDYYVNESPLSSNAMFVYPENEKDVLKELKRRYEG